MSFYDQEAEGWDEWDDVDWYEPEPSNVEYLAWLNEQEHNRGQSLEVSRCSMCEYLFAVVGPLCQFCDAKVVEGVAEIHANFDRLLTNHAAFAAYLEGRNARPAQAA